MGHGSDKLYITHREHTGEFGQHGATTGARAKETGEKFQHLPFDCCAISFQPFETPVCSKEDGTVFELSNVIPFLKKYGVNPATGKKLQASDLIKLHFHKNAEGRYHDPVSFKLFTEHSHLVAIATSGNVYTYETLEQLNFKPKFWKDLVTDESFTKKDVITIQDPHNVSQRDLSRFHHLKNELVVTEADKGVKDEENINIKGMGNAGALLKSMRAAKDGKSTTPTSTSRPPASSSSALREALPVPSTSKPHIPYNAAHYSTGLAAASLTSSAITPHTKSERALVDEEELMYDAVRKMKGEGKSGQMGKAYVRILTNFGAIECELHADKAPKTVYNFLMLAREDKYTDTIFHRNIPGFMIQGGDPTGTGGGGESYWGTPFRDEFDVRGAYTHDDRGVLSMANSGPSTNSSQFFITYRATKHLNGKHTVFGKVVGGMEVLDQMERVPCDPATDRPLRSIRIRDVHIFSDPFAIYKERLEKRLARESRAGEEEMEKLEKKRKREEDRTNVFGVHLGAKGGGGEERGGRKQGDGAPSLEHLLGNGGGSIAVGKYLKTNAGGSNKAGLTTSATSKRKPEPTTTATGGQAQAEIGAAYKKKRASGGGFGNFDSW